MCATLADWRDAKLNKGEIRFPCEYKHRGVTQKLTRVLFAA